MLEVWGLGVFSVVQLIGDLVKTLESAIKGKGRISFPWLIVLSTRHM